MVRQTARRIVQAITRRKELVDSALTMGTVQMLNLGAWNYVAREYSDVTPATELALVGALITGVTAYKYVVRPVVEHFHTLQLGRRNEARPLTARHYRGTAGLAALALVGMYFLNGGSSQASMVDTASMDSGYLNSSRGVVTATIGSDLNPKASSERTDLISILQVEGKTEAPLRATPTEEEMQTSCDNILGKEVQQKYDLETACQRMDDDFLVDPELLWGIWGTETTWNTTSSCNAVDACGPLQIKKTAGVLAVKLLYSPQHAEFQKKHAAKMERKRQLFDPLVEGYFSEMMQLAEALKVYRSVVDNEIDGYNAFIKAGGSWSKPGDKTRYEGLQRQVSKKLAVRARVDAVSKGIEEGFVITNATSQESFGNVKRMLIKDTEAMNDLFSEITGHERDWVAFYGQLPGKVEAVAQYLRCGDPILNLHAADLQMAHYQDSFQSAKGKFKDVTASSLTAYSCGLPQAMQGKVFEAYAAPVRQKAKMFQDSCFKISLR